MKRAWLAVPALALALAGCKSGSSLPNYGMVPDFELVDQNGRPFRNGEQLRGRVWVANMIFTTCMGPCPRMTAQMRQVRDATSNSPDRALVTLTIDPARDTPEVLSAYARRANAGPSWHFLTGPMQELDRLAYDTFHLGHIDGTLEHSTRFVLVDRHERIRGYYDSSDPSNIKALIADLAALEKSGD